MCFISFFLWVGETPTDIKTSNGVWTVSVNDARLLHNSVTFSFIGSFIFAGIKEIEMAKRKSSPSVNRPGTMLDQKTFQDFNNREPALSDPNESKGKVNPEDLNLADQAKDPVSDEIKEEMKPVPAAPRKRTKRSK